MRIGKRLIDRWKADYDFKTMVSAFSSLISTVAFAIYNGFLGVFHASLWHGAICAYYIVLVILRGLILACANKYPLRDRQGVARKRGYMTASALLLLLNISLIVPVSLMVRQQKPVSLTLIPAIAMAAYTAYRVTMASVNLKKRKTSSDSLVRLLRTIHFIDALVSILTLQNTLIMVKANGEDIGMMPLAAAASAAILLAVLLLSVAAIAKGVTDMRSGE